MRALVTGHRGFVGSHLAAHLADLGWEVTGCDIADVQRPVDCREVFERDSTRYDLVVHCAAVVGGRLTISGDPLAVAVDLELDAAMFRWAQRTGQRRVVYFSSSAAYPTFLQEAPGRRLAEHDLDPLASMIGTPDLTYGWAKLTGEMLASHVNVPVHIFRPFSGYGPGQADDYPFPAYVARAARRDDPFDIWGDGEQARDFVHIDDIVATVMAAIDDDHRGPLNIGTGIGTTFNQLAALVCEQAGYQPAALCHHLDKPTGPSHRVADVTVSHQVYKPKISLEFGIAEALAQWSHAA